MRFCSASGVSPAQARMLAYMPYCAGRLCVSIRVEFVMPGHLAASRHTNMQRTFVAMNGRAVITGRGACAITCVRGMGATCWRLCVLLVRARNIVLLPLNRWGCFVVAGEDHGDASGAPNGDPTYVMTKEHAAAFKKVLAPCFYPICALQPA